MELVFGAAILVLAAAVVLLFAMMGELSSRLPTERQAARSTDVFPLEGALLGVQPRRWPDALPPIDGDDPHTVLVLSTACSTCDDVAQQLADELGQGQGGDMAVVVSTGDVRRGEEFVKEYGLDRLPCYVDENGVWVGGELGVRTSPAALVMSSGRLQSALVFHDVTALRAVDTQPKGVQ